MDSQVSFIMPRNPDRMPDSEIFQAGYLDLKLFERELRIIALESATPIHSAKEPHRMRRGLLGRLSISDQPNLDLGRTVTYQRKNSNSSGISSKRCSAKSNTSSTSGPTRL